jgi:hypothetical protein
MRAAFSFSGAAPSRLIAVVLALLLALPSFARDPSQVRAFRRQHPCPSTGRTSGACPHFVIDHVQPICAGGTDHPSNMQWQERQASYQKDAEERRLCRQLKRG